MPSDAAGSSPSRRLLFSVSAATVALSRGRSAVTPSRGLKRLCRFDRFLGCSAPVPNTPTARSGPSSQYATAGLPRRRQRRGVAVRSPQRTKGVPVRPAQRSAGDREPTRTRRAMLVTCSAGSLRFASLGPPPFFGRRRPGPTPGLSSGQKTAGLPLQQVSADARGRAQPSIPSPFTLGTSGRRIVSPR